jgi:ABC-type iron transport system FetAB permease component
VTSAIHIGLGDVAAALTLVAVAVAVAVWGRTDLEVDIAVAAARSFIQLTAIGYVIKAIFASDSILWVALLLAVMVVFGALTARARARRVPTRSGRCSSRSPSPRPPRSRSSSRSASSPPRPATSSPSAAWSSATP